ncbi:hypothetical protein ACOJQI_10825 [Bacillus salacetis]|uniref:hypothetical protein n=1 Tax=Bacillus salacetis TaxID=2315464 RepID=UPI003BA05925
MNEVRDNLKYAGLIFGVSLIIFLAYGFGKGEFDSAVFTLFFSGAVFGHGVAFMRERGKTKKGL